MILVDRTHKVQAFAADNVLQACQKCSGSQSEKTDNPCLAWILQKNHPMGWACRSAESAVALTRQEL